MSWTRSAEHWCIKAIRLGERAVEALERIADAQEANTRALEKLTNPPSEVRNTTPTGGEHSE